MNIDLTGKTAVVTGGTRGIGFATSLAFAKAGANVAALYQKNDAQAELALSAIHAVTDNAIVRKVTIENEIEMALAIGDIESVLGSIDILVCNAGIWEEGTIADMSAAVFERTMQINMTGTFLAVKFAAGAMRRRGSGAIVIVSSTAGQRGEANYSHYAASKGAQISFTKSAAVELAESNIRVNCVAPGWVDTEMTSHVLGDPAERSRITANIPVGRIGRPEDIAHAVLYLASEQASYVTGEVLNVNGGSVLCG